MEHGSFENTLIRQKEEVNSNENLLEQETISALSNIDDNKDLFLELSQKLPEKQKQEYTSKFGKLLLESSEILKKIESISARITQTAILPETRKKISIIKKINPDFHPQVYRPMSFGGASQWVNNFEKIQELDLEVIEKLGETEGIVSFDSDFFVGEYSTSRLEHFPGFVNHLSHINLDNVRQELTDIRNNEKDIEIGNFNIQYSPVRFYIINYEKVKDKKNLAKLSVILDNYFSHALRHDKVGEMGAIDNLDTRRLPGFFVENSQLDIDDEKLSVFLKNPEPEKKINDFILENHPWIKPLHKLTKVQSQAENAQFNLWINDFLPLVKELDKQKIISLDSRKDGELLLEFVKTFGMRNTPDLFKVFADLKRVKNTSELGEKTKNQLRRELNIDVDKICAKDPTNIKLIINEIDGYKQELHNKLKEEDDTLIEKVLTSPLNKDLFLLVKGTSPYWKKKKPIEEILQRYKKTKEKKPEVFKVKEGYEKVTMDIPEVAFTEPTDEIIIEEKRKVLENPNLVSDIKKLREIAHFFSTHNGNIQSTRSDIEKNILKELSVEIVNTKNEYHALVAEENQNEKKLIGLQKKLANLDDSWNTITKLEGATFDIEELLKIYQDKIPDKLDAKRDAISNLSLLFINKKNPGSVYSFIHSSQELSDEAFIKSSASFLSHDIREHILNKSHEPEITSTLAPSAIKGIKKAWGLTDKNIVIESAQKLTTFEKGELTGKNRTITLVPSRGLRKIFSGNIGNSCVDDRENDFAEGKFENITSYALILDEDKKTEKFAGSFFVIETQTENKEPILVIRGNNPSENLFSTLDGDSLIKKIIDQVKIVGTKRGINNVALPLSDVGKSSSNREAVVQYYKTHFSDNQKIGLVKNDETNFNGYPIWNKDSEHAVVKV